MLKICSRFFSGLRSSLLHPDLDIYAGIDLSVTDDTQASRLQAKGWRCYLSQIIGLAVAGSTGPAPPPLQLQAFVHF